MFSQRLHVFASLSCDEAGDVPAIDIRAKTGRRNETECCHAFGVRMRERDGDGTTKRVPDEMHLAPRDGLHNGAHGLLKQSKTTVTDIL